MVVSVAKSEKLLPTYMRSLGDVVRACLEHDHCEDVTRNADGSLWVKYTGQHFKRVGRQSSENALSLIATVASLQGAVVNHEKPVLETVLPDGNRFEGVVPPLVSSPVWTIRCRSKQIYSLESYVESGIMTCAQYEQITQTIRDRKTILVSGGNGSGKTSLLNGVIAQLSVVDPEARLGIIEDTPELRSSLPNHVSFLAGRRGSMLRCLKTCLRMRLDRLAVGEVRGREALTMLKAFNTGYPGMATIHANSAPAAITRLTSLVREAIPNFDATALIRETIHLIVQVDGPTPARPRQISQLWEVAAC